MSEPMLLAFRDKLLEPTSDAFQQAPCRRLPQHWFVPREGHLTRKEKEDILRGAAVCVFCPVIELCAANASEEDRRWTVRAGELPGIVKHGRPKNKIIDGICHRGHDTRVLGRSTDGGCAECKRNHQREERQAAGVAPRNLVVPSLTAEEMLAGVCLQGHDVSAPEDRTRFRQCRSCHATEKRRLDNERRQQKKNQGKGIGSTNRNKTHCPHGHEYNEENTRMAKTIRKDVVYWTRTCRTCERSRRT